MLHRTPFFLPWLYPGLTWRIPTREKEIYLTFDDGPIPAVTEWVLDELQKVNARATFFCIGDNVRRHPGIFQKVVEGGHAIGNHTYNHVKGWNCPTLVYVENVRLCEEQFRSVGLVRRSLSEGGPADRSFSASGLAHRSIGAGGGEVLLFRPPYGRIKRSQIKALNTCKIVMWDVLSFDYSRNTSAENCLKGSIHATRPGSIVVFHDSLKAEKNLKYVLPRYLKYYSDLGYLFKAVASY